MSILSELLKEAGLDKILGPLTAKHYSLDLLKAFVSSRDTYMLETVRQSCGISHLDMDRLKKAIEGGQQQI